MLGIKSPLEIVQEAKEKYGLDRFVMMFSGGKDSITTLHYLRGEIPLELVYCETGIGIRENLEYVKSTAEKYSLKLNIVKPHDYETYEIFIKRFGFPKQGMHNAMMGFLKYHPLRKWYRECQKREKIRIGLVTGRRRAESTRRKNMKTNMEHSKTNDGMVFISPLYHWKNEDVWDYIKTNDIELCPVYQTLHMSGDCMCGAFGDDEEYDLMRIFHPETYGRITELETKYCGKWGKSPPTKKTRAANQTQLNVCNECLYTNK